MALATFFSFAWEKLNTVRSGESKIAFLNWDVVTTSLFNNLENRTPDLKTNTLTMVDSAPAACYHRSLLSFMVFRQTKSGLFSQARKSKTIWDDDPVSICHQGVYRALVTMLSAMVAGFMSTVTPGLAEKMQWANTRFLLEPWTLSRAPKTSSSPIAKRSKFIMTFPPWT